MPARLMGLCKTSVLESMPWSFLSQLVFKRVLTTLIHGLFRLETILFSVFA